MSDAAAVIFFVFLIGAAFTVVDETGALRQGVDWLVRRFGHAERLVIPAAALAFALGGVLDNMKEEIIALVPVMLLLTRRLGLQPVIAVATSLGAAAVGASFSPINPFQVGIAQQLAQLPLLSGSVFRIGFLVLALAVWTWGTVRHATRTRVAAPGDAPGGGDPGDGLGTRQGAALATVLAYQYGGGLCELLTPTDGALMAILAAAGLRYEDWLRFALPLYLVLLGLGALAIGIGIASGLK